MVIGKGTKLHSRDLRREFADVTLQSVLTKCYTLIDEGTRTNIKLLLAPSGAREQRPSFDSQVEIGV